MRNGFLFALIIFTNIINYADRSILAAGVTAIKEEFHTSDALTGTLATIFVVVFLFAAPISGILVTRFSRWKIIGISVLIWSAATAMSGASTSFSMLMASRALVGVGEAAFGPIAPALASELFDSRYRARILSVYYAAMPIGSAIGYILAGIVHKLGGSWRDSFYLMTAPGVVAGFLSLWIVDQRFSNGNDIPERKKLMGLGDVKRLAQTPSFVIVVIGLTLSTFAVGSIGFWSPDYIAWRLMRENKSIENASTRFGGIMIISGLLGSFIGGWVGDFAQKSTDKGLFIVSGIGTALCAPLFVLFTFVPFPFAWLTFFFTSLCGWIAVAPMNTIICNVVPAHLRSWGFAVCIFCIHAFGDAISPPIVGAINDKFNNDMNIGFRFVAGVLGTASIVLLCGCSYLGKDTQRAATEDNEETIDGVPLVSSE